MEAGSQPGAILPASGHLATSGGPDWPPGPLCFKGCKSLNPPTATDFFQKTAASQRRNHTSGYYTSDPASWGQRWPIRVAPLRNGGKGGGCRSSLSSTSTKREDVPPLLYIGQFRLSINLQSDRPRKGSQEVWVWPRAENKSHHVP